MENDLESKDEGNVWASYSDLFTTVAIIFLTMFVFALIRAGISTMQVAVNKKESEKILNGEVSKKEQTKIDLTKQKMNKAIGEMNNFQGIVDEKLKKLGSLSETILGQKNLIEDMLKIQRNRDITLNKLKMDKEKQEQEITKRNKDIKELAQNLKIVEKSVAKKERELSEANRIHKHEVTKLRIIGEKLSVEKKRIGEQLEKERKNVAWNQKRYKDEKHTRERLYNLVNQKEKIVNHLKRDIEYKNKMIDSEKKLIRDQMRRLKKEQMNSKIYAEKFEITNQKLVNLQNTAAKSHEKINEIQKKYQENSKLSNLLKMKISEMTSHQQALEQKYTKLKDEFGIISRKNGEMSKSLMSQGKELENRSRELSHSQKMNQSFQKEFKKIVLDQKNCIEKKEKIEKEISLLGNKYKMDKEKYQKSQKHLALLGNQNETNKKNLTIRQKFRHHLAKKLAKKLKENKIEVFVDRRTGSIVLEVDDDFLYKRNSFILRQTTKNKLNRIIPVYTNILLKDVKIRNAISSINVVGHASPSFNKKYVDPSLHRPMAYKYNMTLSTKRAKEIVEYIISGPFKYQKFLRKLMTLSGKGHSQPIVGKDKSGYCGPYDCRKSRRVEINFSLVDDENIIKSSLLSAI